MTAAGEPCPRGRQAGYSLIEIMVTLAILAAVVAIAVPGAISMVSRYQGLAERRLAEDAISSCRMAAVVSGRAITLPAGQAIAGADQEAGTCQSPPPGWTLRPGSQISFSPAAVCRGGIVDVRSPAQTSYRYEVRDADCQLVAVPAARPQDRAGP